MIFRCQLYLVLILWCWCSYAYVGSWHLAFTAPFNITSYDPVSGFPHSYINNTVPIFGSSLATTRRVCNGVRHMERFECMVAVHHELRVRRVTAIASWITGLLSSFDGEILALLSHLDYLDDLSVVPMSSQRICLLGNEPRFHLLVGLLSFASTTEVFIYHDPQDAQHKGYDMKWFLKIARWNEIQEKIFLSYNKRVQAHLLEYPAASLSTQDDTLGHHPCDILILPGDEDVQNLGEQRLFDILERLTHRPSSTPRNSSSHSPLSPTKQTHILWVSETCHSPLSHINNHTICHLFNAPHASSTSTTNATRFTWQLHRTWPKLSMRELFFRDGSGLTSAQHKLDLVRFDRLSTVYAGTYHVKATHKPTRSIAITSISDTETSLPHRDVNSPINSSQSKPQPCVSDVKSRTILVLSHSVRIYSESALALVHILRHRLHYPHVFLVPEITLDAMQALLIYAQEIVAPGLRDVCNSSDGGDGDRSRLGGDSDSPIEIDLVQIVLTPHEIISLLTPQVYTLAIDHIGMFPEATGTRHNPQTITLRTAYVAFHMEQNWLFGVAGDRMRYPSYEHVLRGACSVWTFSATQQHDLQSRLPHVFFSTHENATEYTSIRTPTPPNIAILPVYSLRAAPDLAPAQQRHHQRTQPHRGPLRVLFYGYCSERRREMVRVLRQHYNRDNAYYSPQDGSTGTPPRRVHFQAFCGMLQDESIQDGRREYEVSRADLVLNWQSNQQSVLEVHRLNFLLGRDKCIVSEGGGDEGLRRQYQRAVHFVSTLVEAVAMIDRYAEDHEARRQEDPHAKGRMLQDCVQRSRQLYEEIHVDTSAMTMAMSEVHARLQRMG